MNALTKIENTALSAMSEQELVEVLRSSLYPGAALQSIKMVLGYCKAAGLDPMRKPVHIVPMWDSKESRMRDVIMPGVGLYRTDAARTGEYAGMHEPEYGPDITETIGGQEITYPQWCRVTVSRRMPSGDIVTFTAREFWKENYAVKGGKEKSIAPNAMWTKRPYGQIAKCAEAQALRKAFPEVGSQPTSEEMEGKTIDDGYRGTTIDASTGEIVGGPPAPPPAPAVWPDDALDKRLAGWKAAIAKGKTVEEIIAWAETKGALTDAQKATIRALAEPAAGSDAAAPAVTYAQIADLIQKAENQAALDAAEGRIPEIPNEKQRGELQAMALRRFEELPAF